MPERGGARGAAGRAGVGAALLLALAFGAGCAEAPDPEPLPPQAATRHRPEPTPTPVPAPAVVPTPAPTTIVIEPPEAVADAARPSLAEAARRERERRATAAPPRVALDNKSLATYGSDQKLTVANPAEPDAGEGISEVEAPPTDPDEAYWREGVRSLRARWRAAVEAVERLETESAALRQQFYAMDDAYARDLQIKPEWDRVLGELDQARRDASALPRELEAFLEEGRRAGALPGWLREGIELEPEIEDADRGEEKSAAEPREPIVVEGDPEEAP